MTKTKEMTPRRKLMVAAVNYLVENGRIVTQARANPLTDPADKGRIIVPVLGKQTQISWHDIGNSELSVFVWWGWHPCVTNSATERNYLVATHGWLERKEDCYLQGSGEQYLSKIYTGRCALDQLRTLPTPIATGFTAEGKFWR